ncbi:hypothetical protein DPMN_076644 [Dreissena polymorpha]|uniref:Potassium channel tetramerisation-type BTB domain-containing protein n=1 Tax=Dreissena polymorpha TaxID=45954 RepID=A0A9D3YJ35_DREPO|nr:hypothetical protein DPMN_076644 [Dreissena polymorpha]
MSPTTIVGDIKRQRVHRQIKGKATKSTVENFNINYSSFIDRDPTYFAIILNHLRFQQQKCHISLAVPNTRRALACISLDARFYGLNSLVKMYEEKRSNLKLLSVSVDVENEIELNLKDS